MATESGDEPTSLASLRSKAFREIIAPELLGEVRDVVVWRQRWRKIANWAEGLAHILQAAGVILMFAVETFKTVNYLSLAAGAVGVLSLALLRFAAYANRESSERNTILGRLTGALGLEALPDIAGEIAGDVEAGAPRARAPGEQAPAPEFPPSRAVPVLARDEGKEPQKPSGEGTPPLTVTAQGPSAEIPSPDNDAS